jgi:hypothetical protein
MRDLKPLPDRDPARSKLAAAIALHAGAVRDWQVAEQAAEQAERRHWEAQSALDELHKAVAPTSGALADSFIASVASGAPCGTDVLERSGVAATARISAAENDVKVWKQTYDECQQASRSKEALAIQAKSRVERCAREVIATSATATRLMDELETKQNEIIGKRVALQFVWAKGLNGELAKSDEERMARLLNQNLSGHGHHPARGAWQAAFDELLTDAEAELPTEFAGAV